VREAISWGESPRTKIFYLWGCGSLEEGLGDLWKPTWLKELAPNMCVLQLLSQIKIPESQSANKIYIKLGRSQTLRIDTAHITGYKKHNKVNVFE
jgi:hypothetical protein